MKHKIIAKIYWLSPKEGGREHPPPSLRYSTVARFEKAAEKWPGEAWSIVADFIQESDDASTVLAELRFLSPNAPANLLKPGSKFELFEGHRLVARGEVLKNVRKMVDKKSKGVQAQLGELV